MSMKLVSLHGPSAEIEGTVTVDRHWYLTEDQTKVVQEGDPAGRWLWATPGMQVPAADAVRLGAAEHPSLAAEDAEDAGTSATPEDAETSEEAEAEEKKAKPAANKARRPAANKSTVKDEE